MKAERKQLEKVSRKKKRKKSVAAPVVQLVQPTQLKISYEALAQVRSLKPQPSQLYTATPGFNPKVFAPARPPPGVVPRGSVPMALDEDLGAWAGAWSSNAWSENLIWLGYPFLAELAQRAEYRQITETLAKEMTRRWIRVSAKGDDDKTERIDAINEALDKHQIRQKFRRLAELDGFFGRGHLYIDTGITNDLEQLKTALVLDRRLNDKGFLQGFRVVEPMWLYPGTYNSSDPLAEDFYRPHTWYVFGKEVHASRIRPLVSRELSDMLKPAYAFSGLSMSQLARPYIDNWLRTRQSVSDLVHAFSVSGLKTDLSTILQGGSAENMMMRAQLYAQTRDNMGMMLVNKDTEEFFNVSTPLGTLDHLQAQAQEQLASVSHIPLIVLLGITPSGLNASSDGEIQIWAQYVRSMQEHLFDDPLRFVIDAIQLDLFGDVDPDIDFDYEPLRELSEAEEATARKTDAETDATYVNSGVLAPDEVRAKLAADPDNAYAGLDLSGPAPEPIAPPDSSAVPPDGDPLGGPPDAPGGAPAATANRASGRFGDASGDALGAVAAAIAARRQKGAKDETAYEHWWEGTDPPSPALEDVAAAIADLHTLLPASPGGGLLSEAPAAPDEPTE